MKRAEIARCVKLVGDRVDRHQTIGLDTGGYALTVQWIDGGQKLFYTYDQVRAWVEQKHISNMIMQNDADLRDEVAAAVMAADVCCEVDVCDAVLVVAMRGGEWVAELAKFQANDQAERNALGMGE